VPKPADRQLRRTDDHRAEGLQPVAPRPHAQGIGGATSTDAAQPGARPRKPGFRTRFRGSSSAARRRTPAAGAP
jgi:hypothetical protein